MFTAEHLMAAMLSGLLLGMGFCALAWWSGERAERHERIARARGRDHSKVPSIRHAVASGFDRFQDRLAERWIGPL